MTVDAGPATMQVIGGNSLQLSGSADNPNVPDNLYTVTPTYNWSIISYGGLDTGTLTLTGTTSSTPTLNTPVVTAATAVTVRLQAEEWECDCWDDVIINILPEGSSVRSAGISYSIAGEAAVPAGPAVTRVFPELRRKSPCRLQPQVLRAPRFSSGPRLVEPWLHRLLPRQHFLLPESAAAVLL